MVGRAGSWRVAALTHPGRSYAQTQTEGDLLVAKALGVFLKQPSLLDGEGKAEFNPMLNRARRDRDPDATPEVEARHASRHTDHGAKRHLTAGRQDEIGFQLGDCDRLCLFSGVDV
jgi:hypothetical protein